MEMHTNDYWTYDILRLCSYQYTFFSGATNLRQLFDALPPMLTTYENFVEQYNNVVQLISGSGGYTNMERLS